MRVIIGYWFVAAILFVGFLYAMSVGNKPDCAWGMSTPNWNCATSLNGE